VNAHDRRKYARMLVRYLTRDRRRPRAPRRRLDAWLLERVTHSLPPSTGDQLVDYGRDDALYTSFLYNGNLDGFVITVNADFARLYPHAAAALPAWYKKHWRKLIKARNYGIRYGASRETIERAVLGGTVRHKDGDPHNNTLSNLERVDPRENRGANLRHLAKFDYTGRLR